MKKAILELIKKIYGSNALSKVLGTRTNVIRLPDNELKQYTNKELNIEAASDKLAQKAKADMYELLAEYPRMNDAEKLIFDGNLTRLGNKLEVVQKKQGPAADVIKFEINEKVSPEGVMSLTEKIKQKNPLGSTSIQGAKKTQVTDLKTEATKRTSIDDLMDEYNANQDRLRLSDQEGGTLIGYEEYEQLRKRNKDIAKALEDKGISSKVEKKPEAEIIPFTNKSDPEDFATGGRAGYAKGGILKFLSKLIKNKDVNKTSIDLTEKELKYLNELITDTGGGKFKAEILEEVPSLTIKNNKLIVDQGDLDSFSKYLDDLYLYELAPSGRGANLMPPRLRGSALFDDSVVGKLFRQSKATGGRVGMAGGGILKLAMKFFNDNNPVSAYKKYLKYVKETAQKDPAKLAPEVGGIVVGSELIHRGLRRKLKEVKEKNNENDSENLATDSRTEKAGGGVSQGLDYLTGIERRG
jgi:hypothetical protein